MSKANIKRAQEMLIASGFPLPRFGADGDFGNETMAAFLSAMEDLSSLRGHIVADISVTRPYTLPSPADRVVAKQPKATRLINAIINHCTATPEGREVSVATIRKWHTDQGWKDIGYHYVVHLDGTIEAGRPESQVGSHVAGHNTGSLGVVYVGGTDKSGKPKDTRTEAQKAALIDLNKALIRKYPAIKKIAGHNDYTNAKACPSFKVGNDPLGKIL